MIRLENICRDFSFPVLKNVSCEFEEGKIYLLKGKSGSGKTTLLNILSGLDSSYSGKYYFDGKEIEKGSIAEQKMIRDEVSYILQDSLLLHHLTVKENLSFLGNSEGKITRLAKEFHVEDLLEKYPSTISGGERQRIALMRALLENNKMIIADEPTSNLDRKNGLEFVRWIEKLKDSNKIIIIATHKDIYDELAVQILTIEFGHLLVSSSKDSKKVKKNNTTKKNEPIPKKNVNLWKENLKYIRAKTREKKSWDISVF